jgi:hypothetical protein
MASLFGVDLRAVFAEVFAPGVLDATLIKVTAGTRKPGKLTGGTDSSEVCYSAKGLVEDYSEREIDGTLIRRGDRIVTLVAGSIGGGQVPTPADKVTIDGDTYELVAVMADSASATYECQARRV